MKTKVIKAFAFFIILLMPALATSAQTATASLSEEKQKISKEENSNQKSLRELEIELEIKKLELEIERRKNTSNNLDTISKSTTSAINVSTKNEIVSETKKPEEQPKVSESGSLPQANQTNDKCALVNLNRANSTEFDRNLCDAVDLVVADGKLDLTGVRKELAVLYLYSAQKNSAIKNFILQLEKTRTDKQIGNDAKGSGTTSLVVKGGAPRVIGWAVENGAATSSISGTTVTIRANPIGFINALAGQSFIGDFDKKLINQDDSFTRALKRASVGFSFDMTRGVETPTFLANQQQLSAVSFRYELINHRNPLRPAYRDNWNNFFNSQIKNLTSQVDAVNALIDPTTETYTNEDLRAWFDATNRKLAEIPRNTDGSLNRVKIREVLEEQLKELPIDKLLNNPAFKNALLSLGEAGVSYSRAREEFLETLNKGTIVTFEYTNNREPIAPDTSNFRFIAERGLPFGSGVMDLTFNASLTMYNKKPTFTGVKRIRDFQFALQLDTPLKDTFGLGDSILSFAGRYERLNSDIVDALGVVKPNSKGDIAVGQIKLTIPIADWGIRLPLSVTFANRTSLIKESEVRGNFGFTFDLDPLFARFKPF